MKGYTEGTIEGRKEGAGIHTDHRTRGHGERERVELWKGRVEEGTNAGTQLRR
jgi:hypothetical protein